MFFKKEQEVVQPAVKPKRRFKAELVVALLEGIRTTTFKQIGKLPKSKWEAARSYNKFKKWYHAKGYSPYYTFHYDLPNGKGTGEFTIKRENIINYSLHVYEVELDSSPVES